MKVNGIKSHIDKLKKLLGYDELKKTKIIFLSILIVSFLEISGIALVAPYLSMVMDPNILSEQGAFKKIFELFGIYEYRKITLITGFALMIVLISSSVLKIKLLKLQVYYSSNQEAKIGSRLLKYRIASDYEMLSKKDSTSMSKDILAEVANVVSHSVMPTMTLVTNLILTLSILTYLFFFYFEVTAILTVIVTLFYYFIVRFFGENLKNVSIQREMLNDKRYGAVFETFRSIREIKFTGNECVYLKQFEKISKEYSDSIAKSQIYAQTPRYILEGFFLGGIIAFVIYMIIVGDVLVEHIPVVSVFVFSAFKIIPSMQLVYSSLTYIKFIGPSLDRLSGELFEYEKNNLMTVERYSNIKDINFNHMLSLKDIWYRYDDKSNDVITGLNLSVRKGVMIGITGKSGSGKSTLLDVMLGLVENTRGTIAIDDKQIEKQDFQNFRNLIGYVPQDVFLANSSIKDNISFGIPKSDSDIDLDHLNKIAEVCMLHSLINSSSSGYDALISENGKNLSGGERQRIGLARALFRNPQILVLDEATSALDIDTEIQILKNIRDFKKDMTIISVAHRINSIEVCDQIYRLYDGLLVECTF
jgi:ABC-type multidrug transport system fused ATPase/permease subunit